MSCFGIGRPYPDDPAKNRAVGYAVREIAERAFSEAREIELVVGCAVNLMLQIAYDNGTIQGTRPSLN